MNRKSSKLEPHSILRTRAPIELGSAIVFEAIAVLVIDGLRDVVPVLRSDVVALGIVGVLTVIIVVIAYLRYRSLTASLRQTTQSLQEATKIVEQLPQLDQDLLDLIDQHILMTKTKEGAWIDPLSLHANAKRVVEGYLEKAMLQFFDDKVNRASYFVPDQSGGCLELWGSQGMSARDEEETRGLFTVPTQPGVGTPQGLTGWAYTNHERQLCVFERDADGRWIASNPHYAWPPGHDQRQGLRYQAIMAIPVLDSSRSLCLGVLCFDSMFTDAFDDPKLSQWFDLIGKRVASVVTICDDLEGLRPASPSSTMNDR